MLMMTKIFRRLSGICLLILIGLQCTKPSISENDTLHEPEQQTSAVNVLAFPGVEGFGSYTTGGRKGQVIYVTNLNDSGPGSLRAAIETTGPRMVLFKVSGTIQLQSDLEIINPYITIAGQTAPGGGICLKDYQTVVRGHDVIIRHIRFRSGETTRKEQMSLKLMKCYNVVIDHCSCSWALDENLTSSGIYNITIQNTIVGEGLSESFHPKGEHSMGSLLSGIGGVSIIHSLYTTNRTRNPRVYNMLLDLRNNVIYNWGTDICYTSEGGCFLNMRDNYLKPGPACSSSAASRRAFKPGNIFARVFIDGNVLLKQDGSIDEIRTEDNRQLVQPTNEELKNEEALNTIIVHTPFETPPLTNYKNPRTQLFDYVLENVGAILPQRDAADNRMIDNVRNGTGTLINFVSPESGVPNAGGWPELASGSPPADSDGDGMPDEWEMTYGFDPKDASDGIQDIDKDGYTNLEEYLNGSNPLIAEDRPPFSESALTQIQQNALKLVAEGMARYAAYVDESRDSMDRVVQELIRTLPVTISPTPSPDVKKITVNINGTPLFNMVRIEPGTFLMGSPPEEIGAISLYSEKPQHAVTLTKAFYMAETAVTKAHIGAILKRPYDESEADMPASTTWYDACDMAAVLKGATGYHFKLPTEAQWEYACRAGTTTAFNNGRNTITTEEANFDGTIATEWNPIGIRRGEQVAVKSFPPNAWGLYEMHGNGYEFCEDVAARVYTTAAVTDPVGSSSTTEVKRCMRGGGASSSAVYIRSAARYQYDKKVNYGCRLILEIP